MIHMEGSWICSWYRKYMKRARWHVRCIFLQMVDTSIDTLWCVVSLHISFQTCLAWWRGLGCLTVVVKPRLWQCYRLSWCNVDFYNVEINLNNLSQTSLRFRFRNHFQTISNLPHVGVLQPQAIFGTRQLPQVWRTREPQRFYDVVLRGHPLPGCGFGMKLVLFTPVR